MTSKNIVIDTKDKDSSQPASRKLLECVSDAPVSITHPAHIIYNRSKDWEQKNMAQDGVRWETEWYEFTQSTTFHGVNKITQETPFIARR